MKKRKKERKTKRMNASRQTTHSKIKKWDFAVCLVMASVAGGIIGPRREGREGPKEEKMTA